MEGRERNVDSNRPRAPSAPRPGRWLRDPVAPILIVAGIFDWISGNPPHSILLFAVAAALLSDALFGGTGGQALPVSASKPLPLPPLPVALTVGLLYAIVVGSLGRYSWPITVAVIVPAAGVLALAWRRSRNPPGDQGRLPATGTIAWASAFVALGLWELAALLLQPSLTTDSPAHPTLSVLTDPALATHLGRSIALFVWLAIGWFLLQT